VPSATIPPDDRGVSPAVRARPEKTLVEKHVLPKEPNKNLSTRVVIAMKTQFAFASLLLLSSLSAFGMGGELVSPSIAYPSDLDADRKEQIHKLVTFMKDDLRFIEGSFLNEFSNQRFGGTSSQVSRFIALLSGVGLWEVHVQFRDFGEQESAFSLDQDSSKTFLRVIVNSGRKDFLLRDFAPYLPPPKLPESNRPKAEQGGATNGIQPISADTNRTSPEVGSRR
jgi:hypothetical protein